MTQGRSGPEGAGGRFPVENDKFAQIVVAEGFCTLDQIDLCLRIQSNTEEHLSLGQSLLREGYLTSDQYSRVLVLLRKGYKKDRDDVAASQQAEHGLALGRASARQGQEDRVLGEILVTESLITAGQLKVCMETSAKSRCTLAESLVTLGYLERARIQAILARLERSEHSCPSCGATLSVVRLPTAKAIRCPRCRKDLA